MVRSGITNQSDKDSDSARVVRHYVEVVWNGGDLDALSKYVSSDHLRHDPAGNSQGMAELAERISAFRTAFPDLHFEVEIYAANDGGQTVVRRWVMTGTHSGDYAGVCATGRTVTSTGMAISRLREGKIVEEWINRDDLGLLRQLGAMG